LPNDGDKCLNIVNSTIVSILEFTWCFLYFSIKYVGLVFYVSFNYWDNFYYILISSVKKY
jgi:hypothetical protein